MVNLSGVTGSLSALINPKIILPRLIIPDISYLNWKELKLKGVTGIVIDKDNCITKPGQDHLVPSLKSSWNELLTTFGSSNVLIVSNSAGTNKDSLLLQAESVSRNLQVPVLIHPVFKPGKQCALSTAHYFQKPPPPPPSSPLLRYFKRKIGLKPKPLLGQVVWSHQSRSIELYPTPLPAATSSASTSLSTLPPSSFSSSTTSSPTTPPHQVLLVIGDRLATDMILSHRLSSLSSSSSSSPSSRIQTIPILTTTLHASESLGTTFLRLLEKLLLRLMKNRTSTLSFQSQGPWNSCLLSPSSSPVPIPIPSLSTTSSSSYSPFPPLVQKLFKPIIKNIIMLHKAFNSPKTNWNWNWTEKNKELYKAPGGLEDWAEKFVDGVEGVVKDGRKKMKRVW